MKFYGFFNPAGRLLRVLSERFVNELPDLAAKLSPVPLSELPRYEFPSGKPLHVQFTRRNFDGEFAWMFYPAKRDNVQTVFSNVDGVWRVEKRVLHRALRSPFCPFRQLALDPEPLLPGIAADVAMAADVQGGAWSEAMVRLESFFKALVTQYPLDKKGRLPAGMVDALPRNAVAEAKGGLHFFDLEYARRGGVRLSFLIYRAIKMDLLFHLPKAERGQIDFKGSYESLCLSFGVKPRFRSDARESCALKRFTSGSLRRTLCRFFLLFVPKRARPRHEWWSGEYRLLPKKAPVP
ncbi:MAG: hypothetical protein J6Z49_03865 [Kiritimatiellae bacterium]|nr:hypothetical protein [Kiritimatiellia bacterium]